MIYKRTGEHQDSLATGVGNGLLWERAPERGRMGQGADSWITSLVLTYLTIKFVCKLLWGKKKVPMMPFKFLMWPIFSLHVGREAQEDPKENTEL